MASRPELIECCEYLDIDSTDLSIEEMKEVIREKADKVLNKKWHISADNIPESLQRFLIHEYDYVIKDRKGNIIDI